MAFTKIGNQKSKIENFKAFTIVELLVVISIIGILAALLLPALSAATNVAKKRQARLQISDIVTAIQQYDSAYSRFPISIGVQGVAGGGEFTYGGTNLAPYIISQGGPIPNMYVTNNSEVIAILMDITKYPNTGLPTANDNHQKNPQQTIFLNAKMSGWDPSQGGTPKPGVGNDLVYRDPWGNPYVITMDLDEEGNVKDAFYCLSVVSGPNGNNQPGLNGLINPNNTPDNFQYHGSVMVWSAGPDKKIDPTVNATTGANKDNILSWQ